ncbi:hypothetical protein RRG08_023230 [Elysia crispata]|uniref:Uncharacterized protein n=1 Tax=Elysia crispata TaxID=231223 RepID=A0AAE0ZQ16_9GAST|nr:hypothetical protein RRG08_023230 [Elysia crispata]
MSRPPTYGCHAGQPKFIRHELGCSFENFRNRASNILLTVAFVAFLAAPSPPQPPTVCQTIDLAPHGPGLAGATAENPNVLPVGPFEFPTWFLSTQTIQTGRYLLCPDIEP